MSIRQSLTEMVIAKEQVYIEAERAGIDLDLLETNLRLTVAERWRQHDAALNLVLRLQEAKRISDARSDGAATTNH